MNLTIEMPDDLARILEGIASAHNKTVQQFALEHLRDVAADRRLVCGSPAALLEAMFASPRLTESDVAELEAAISAGRLPTTDIDPFAN